jgi:carboxypeptidase Q
MIRAPAMGFCYDFRFPQRGPKTMNIKSGQLRPLLLLSFGFALSMANAYAADKPKTAAAEAPSSYEGPQPDRETLDLNMYQRIREEGINHSHIMEYASALTDGIGPRLTGSPNMAKANAWTRDQFTAMGCANAHLESWGEFGMGWQQLNAWIRMTAPDTAVFIAQALPWSPATAGPVTGEAIWLDVKSEKDLEKYKGKLSGKIILVGDMREAGSVDKPLLRRYDEKEIQDIQAYPLSNPDEDFDKFIKEFMDKIALRGKIGKLAAEEHALAILVPSRDSGRHGGSGGTIFVDSSEGLDWFAYKRDHVAPLPVMVMAIENYGRVYRLVKAHVPVSLELNVDTKFTGDHEEGFDTVAEIPGTDSRLKDELVMVGGHLDSWASGTGATDNGAGSLVAMEVMRILNSLGVKPRRTIRVALWSGEEEGLFGSVGYVKEHFGSFPLSDTPEQKQLPEFFRKPAGRLTLKPEQKLVSGYFNVDNGGGRVRGVYLQGNAAIEPIFKQWIAPLQDLGVATLSLQNTGGTDHLSFDAVGIPGFQFIQDPLDYGSRTHHTNMDTYERLLPEDMKQAAVVEAIFVYNAAMRDQMLPRKPLPHPELEEKRNTPLPNVMPGAIPPLAN